MIETVGDLIKLLHCYPSATRVVIGNNCDDTAQLNGGVLNLAVDEIVLTLAPLVEETPKKTSQQKAKRLPGLSDDAAEAIEQCDHILSLCDDVEGRGEDFASDIAEKVQSVRDWIEENDHVTEKQLSALEGWERGVSRWLKD